MRYLPLDADRPRPDADARSARLTSTPCSPTFPPPSVSPRRSTCRNGLGEIEVERALARMAGRNVAAGSVPFFVGAGAYRHHVPATVDHLIQRSEFLTSYTPYQPEIAQGTLQVLFEFQTQVAALTGMEVANASMYDGSTACGEAMLMAHRAHAPAQGGAVGRSASALFRRRRHARRDGERRVVRLPLDPRAAEDIAAQIDDETSCVVVQTPDFFGNLRDLTPIAAAAHAKGALLVAVVTEAVSLGAVRSPGEMGADIVVGEGQSIGNALNFGGPYVGLFATRLKYVRQMPGRLAGETVDADGRRGFVLTLSTREQHIRREKATSNICTNSGLCALAFSIHLTLLGEAGLRRARRAQSRRRGRPRRTARRDARASALLNDAFFNEFTIRTPREAAGLIDDAGGSAESSAACRCRGSRRRAGLDDLIVVAATEIDAGRRPARLCGSARAMSASGGHSNEQPGPPHPPERAATAPRRGTFTGNRALDMEEALIFETGRLDATGVDFETPAPFASKLGAHARDGAIGLPGLTEPEAVRHYVRLSRKNYAIDAGLYPLGSCTMKHNPRLNEKMARLPGFADLHPLQPISTVQGALELIDSLAHGC